MSGEQRSFSEAYVGFRKTWLTLFDDGAGDGYFLDTARNEAEGAVFYSFAEDGQYVFFPSIKNLLAAVAKGYEEGALPWKDSGVGPAVQDIERWHKIELEYGARPER